MFQVKQKSEALRVRMTNIDLISKGELDKFYYLKVLEIEANYNLKFLESGIFRNLTELEQLSISYNTHLQSIAENLFLGLKKLINLTLVENGFTNLLYITPSLQPNYLPSLKRLDLSLNIFGVITYDAFEIMKGTKLNSLKIALCQIDYIHPKGFLPLKHLEELHIGENDLDSSIIQKFLKEIVISNISLHHLDISTMGFKKFIPKTLLNTIAESNITKLILAQNKFEMITEFSFPRMDKIELLDLRKVSAVFIDKNAFNPEKFPNLKALFLGGNNLPGIHAHLSTQLKLLDISYNSGNPSSPVYFEIGRDTFVDSQSLQVLNLSYNRIKSIFDYTFTGLGKLKVLNLENGTLFHIGSGTFLSTKELEVLNLANNPITLSENLTRVKFEGLSALKILILSNCGIRYLHENNNILQATPNVTHLILKNNLLIYIAQTLLTPLKRLKVLDLSGNLLISWWRPLFLSSGIKPQQLLIGNNKINQFSVGMLKDINYLLNNNKTKLMNLKIDLMDNVFVCDCSSMYRAFMWLEKNGSVVLKNFFKKSNFQCSTPDLWENRRVADYFSSIKSVECIVYEKMTNVMLLLWTLPSCIVIVLILVVSTLLYKYRFYVRYWIFLAKIALGRTMRLNKVENMCINKEQKYDAFVSYCNDDREIVVQMISELETKPPYLKLCIYERDFEIGSYISESIMSSINESRYILLIISNNFAKSQWCRWETQLAEYHRFFLEDGTCCDPLVLVRVGNIEQKYMTPTLKYLLNTKIYLDWNMQNADFWVKLRRVLSKGR